MMRPQDIVETALARAGGARLAVLVSASSQVNLRWANNSMTTNGDLVGQEVDIVAFQPVTGGVASATVSGQVQREHDVAELVQRAAAAASAGAAAEDAADLVAGEVSPDWSADTPHTGPAAVAHLASGLGEVFRRGDADGVSHFGYAEHESTTLFLGTSAGTRLRHTQVTGRLELTARSEGGSAWHGSAATSFDGAEPAAIDELLRQRLSWQRNSIDVPPGRQPVLLSPSAVADLMVDLYWSADAESAHEGRSVFARPDGGTRVGDDLGGGVTLSSDPAAVDASMRCEGFVSAVASSASSSPFDNGLPVTATDWISGGVLSHLVTTRHTAAVSGLPHTPWIDNLSLHTPSGRGRLDDVVARMDSGLLVTCLWYNRVVDPQTLLLTGLTRDGVYVVRDGEVVGACGNFRFNESPVSLLGRIVDSGTVERTLPREVGDYFNRTAMPPLLVSDFNLSTASDAR